LRRRMRLFRLPEDNPHRQVTLQRTIPLADDRDNALYVRITFEDGHIAWSSPMYIFHHKNF
jgi:PhoPQ-activated pathogenicity-related protein